jgi:signal transduction histidine kinase
MFNYLLATLVLTTSAVLVFAGLFVSSQKKKRVFYDIGHDLGRAMTLEEVLQRIAATSALAASWDVCGVAMVSFRKGTLAYRHLQEKHNQPLEGLLPLIPLDDPESPEARCVRENGPTRCTGRSLIPGKASGTILCLPLRYLTDTVAVLTLENRRGPVSRRGQRFLEELSPFYAVFIKNILHREDLEDTVTKKTGELKKKNRELTATIQRLNETREQLITSEKMASLGKLVAGVAHEINTPVGSSLTGITHLSALTKNIGHLLESDELSREDLDEYLSESRESARLIEQELQRASQLIRSFKQVSADRSSQVKRVFEVRGYMMDIMLSMRNLLKKRRVQLLLDCPEGIVLESYPGSFSQILNNLIMNSLVHAYGDEDTGTMRIRIRSENDDLVLTFTDDGRGIPEKIQKKIFEPFFTTAHDRGGTGLGLNIIYNIVTNTLCGRILCESREQEGTTFEIRFPINSDDSTDHDQEEPGDG